MGDVGGKKSGHRLANYLEARATKKTKKGERIKRKKVEKHEA